MCLARVWHTPSANVSNDECFYCDTQWRTLVRWCDNIPKRSSMTKYISSWHYQHFPTAIWFIFLPLGTQLPMQSSESDLPDSHKPAPLERSAQRSHTRRSASVARMLVKVHCRMSSTGRLLPSWHTPASALDKALLRGTKSFVWRTTEHTWAVYPLCTVWPTLAPLAVQAPLGMLCSACTVGLDARSAERKSWVEWVVARMVLERLPLLPRNTQLRSQSSCLRRDSSLTDKERQDRR